MKKQLCTIAAGLSLTAAGLLGQTETQPMVAQFQQAGTISTVVSDTRIFPFGGRGALVTGSPVSAKEVNKTVQTLSDGTELENTQTTMFYRDGQGRTRTEPAGGNGPIQIVDPVAGMRITLDPATKTGHRMPAPATAVAGGRAMPRAAISTDQAELADKMKFEAAAAAESQAKATAELTYTLSQTRTMTTKHDNSTTEDLGFQMQNGILAQGSRTTLVIPKGQIGNNRDIHVVNERWYSKDLQMMVKSVNSDPRFGTTTYDLTNIVQGADPTLFQIPGSYTVTDGPGRGARGGTVVVK